MPLCLYFNKITTVPSALERAAEGCSTASIRGGVRAATYQKESSIATLVA